MPVGASVVVGAIVVEVAAAVVGAGSVVVVLGTGAGAVMGTLEGAETEALPQLEHDTPMHAATIVARSRLTGCTSRRDAPTSLRRRLTAP